RCDTRRLRRESGCRASGNPTPGRKFHGHQLVRIDLSTYIGKYDGRPAIQNRERNKAMKALSRLMLLVCLFIAVPMFAGIMDWNAAGCTGVVIPGSAAYACIGP